MNYLVIGAGGTGGAIGGFLAKAGKDVTLIARGRHLDCMRERGLRLETPEGCFTVPVQTCTMEDYHGVPDVIFVCVKGYSLEETVPFLRRTADRHTVVIPVLNLYGTGKRLQERLPGVTVTDGCIYIASEIKQPGTLLLSGTIFRVVYGLRRDASRERWEALSPVLEEVARDLEEAGIRPLLSRQIERDALQKFSFVSPMAAVGAACGVQAGDMQAEGGPRDTFAALVEEIRALSQAMGVDLPEDIAQINLKIMDDLAPTATASMQRDIESGKQSEVDGLVFQVLRWGEQYKVPMPCYRQMAEKLEHLRTDPNAAP